KLAESGEGSVLRFIELGGARAEVSVESPLLKNAAAAVCNAVEECGPPPAGASERFGFGIAPRQIFTLKVSPARETAGQDRTRSSKRD
ncbi:MAG TPA: glycosyl hydrolase-related protein, partial [Pyrinomonadaceae bacterium]|nr:glycosyl hydrolase-related protein [Pyrinomonadaceae bacterium]